jgi:hypothetical protein
MCRQQQQPTKMQIISIPTAAPSSSIRRQYSTNTKRDDAFSKYTNDATRLQTLLLKDDNFNLNEFATKHYTTPHVNISSTDPTSVDCNPQDQDTIRVKRKTRISWELHPSLILDEMMTEMPDMDVLAASNNAMIEDDNIADDTDSNKEFQELLEQLIGSQ